LSGCSNITFNESNPSNAVFGEYYNQMFNASSGVPPYSYSVINSILPSGISLDSSTGDLSGTPDDVGTFDFEIMATDSVGCMGFASYYLTIGM
jgi:hypothetical protein